MIIIAELTKKENFLRIQPNIYPHMHSKMRAESCKNTSRSQINLSVENFIIFIGSKNCTKKQ